MNTVGALQLLLCTVAGYSIGNVLYNQLRTGEPNRRMAVYFSILGALVLAEIGNLLL